MMSWKDRQDGDKKIKDVRKQDYKYASTGKELS